MSFFDFGEKEKFSRVDKMEQDMIQRKNKAISFISMGLRSGERGGMSFFDFGEKAKFLRVDKMEQDMIQRKNKFITFIS